MSHDRRPYSLRYGAESVSREDAIDELDRVHAILKVLLSGLNRFQLKA